MSHDGRRLNSHQRRDETVLSRRWCELGTIMQRLTRHASIIRMTIRRRHRHISVSVSVPSLIQNNDNPLAHILFFVLAIERHD